MIFLGLVVSCKEKNSDTSSVKEIEEVVENYGTGQISRTYQRKNGQIDGLMKDFYPDGSPKGERYFENGMQVGKTTLYYNNGEIMEVQYYENGLKNGGDTVFYESGKVKFAVTYKDEKKNGYLRKWSEDGILVYEAKFELDSLVEVKGESIK